MDGAGPRRIGEGGPRPTDRRLNLVRSGERTDPRAGEMSVAPRRQMIDLEEDLRELTLRRTP